MNEMNATKMNCNDDEDRGANGMLSFHDVIIVSNPPRMEALSIKHFD